MNVEMDGEGFRHSAKHEGVGAMTQSNNKVLVLDEPRQISYPTFLSHVL